MYGTILKLGMKAAPHLVKAAVPVYAGTAAVNAFAPDFIKDAYRGSIEGDDDGIYKGKGLTAAFLKPFVDEGTLESAEQQKAVKRVLAPSGYTAAELGLADGSTFIDAETAVAAKKREAAETIRAENRSDLLRPLEMQMAENAATRAEAQLIRADELALRREQLMREDQRYNDQIIRDERTKNQQIIMAMMSGVSNLGAAFA